MEWDILLVQEARVSPDAWALQDAARQGMSVQLGRLGADGKPLLCALSRSGCLSAVTGPPGVDEERVQALTWYPGGSSSWRLFNVYGHADGAAESRLLTSHMVRAATAEAEASRKQPSIIAGDLNAHLDELPVAFALGCSDWRDPGAGKGTSSAAWEPRRIDCTLLNPAMRNRLVGHSMAWDTGMPTHAVQSLRLRAGQLPDCPQWEQTPGLPEPQEQGMSRVAAAAAVRTFLEQCTRHVSARELDQAWATFTDAATRYAYHRAGTPYAGPRPRSKVVVKPPEPVIQRRRLS